MRFIFLWKLYVSVIFDRYDLAVLGLAMDTNMKATLCEQTLDNAYKAYPLLQICYCFTLVRHFFVLLF